MTQKPLSHRYVVRLFRRIHRFEPNFPSAEQMRRFRVKATEVPLADTDDGTLDFNPCYFKPHPSNLLERYPPHPSVGKRERRSLELESTPSVQEIMDTSWKFYPPDVEPITENLDQDDFIRWDMQNDAYDQSRATERTVRLNFEVTRQAGSKEVSLQGLANQGGPL